MEHVKTDIDAVFMHVRTILDLADDNGNISGADLRRVAGNLQQWDQGPFNAAYNWMASGMKSVFLQDANSLIIKPADLVDILNHLKARFPWVERITSYARSHTVARIKDEDLKAIREAGLNRIHIGLESGSDEVLKVMKKGCDQGNSYQSRQKGQESRDGVVRIRHAGAWRSGSLTSAC